MFNRVEVEFLSGPENTKDRRIFEKVKVLEFVQDSHLRIVSIDDGEMMVKWDRLQWYHTQPLSQLDREASIDHEVIAAGQDGQGKFTLVINAIKKYRELTGQGLKESKVYVDNLRSKMPY